MIDGSVPPQSSNVIPLTVFKFERLLQSKLDPVLDETLEVTLMESAGEPFKIDDELLDNVVERVIDALDGQTSDTIRSYDHVRAKLRCHCCRSIADETTTDCETYIGCDAAERDIRIGSTLTISESDVSADFYVKVNDVNRELPIHVIEGWWCQRCASVNWAEIVVADDTVRSIWSTTICPELLERTHYMSSEIIEFVADKHDRPAWSLSHEEILGLLRTS